MGTTITAEGLERLKTKVWVTCVLQYTILGLVLFGAAGTLNWVGAWVWLFINVAISIPTVILLLKNDPDLLNERLKFPVQKTQKDWDKVLLSVLLSLWGLWFPLMALDAVRFQWSTVPVWLQMVGALALIGSIYIIYMCFRANSYLAPVVKIQTERGHQVVSSGPYSIVRHPMYAGALIYFPATALLLGSWYGFVASLILNGLLVARTVLEDKTLQQELPGYSQYAQKVRHRLLPGVW